MPDETGQSRWTLSKPPGSVLGAQASRLLRLRASRLRRQQSLCPGRQIDAVTGGSAGARPRKRPMTLRRLWGKRGRPHLRIRSPFRVRGNLDLSVRQPLRVRGNPDLSVRQLFPRSRKP